MGVWLNSNQRHFPNREKNSPELGSWSEKRNVNNRKSWISVDARRSLWSLNYHMYRLLALPVPNFQSRGPLVIHAGSTYEIFFIGQYLMGISQTIQISETLESIVPNTALQIHHGCTLSVMAYYTVQVPVYYTLPGVRILKSSQKCAQTHIGIWTGSG